MEGVGGKGLLSASIVEKNIYLFGLFGGLLTHP